ncbi:ABC transporter ATP-binding protein [Amycolatopsis sp. GM8]|uniref:ABC transporter ATP-binding protein n=1 Tax=Amycolatopsis sp. GM8 TaxID=2896530 RepID=UPI001F3B7AF6|nr:ABC transporter ATP-binding protein [Amycolatopsis sp. GM8]
MSGPRDKESELLAVADLHKTFRLRGGREASAVDGVTMSVAAGATLGIVGESGCGKSTLARMIVGLVQPDRGRISFDGKPLPAERSGEARRDIQMVFQDPYSALNPKASVGDSVGLALRVHGHDRAETRRRVRALLDQVGLHANHASYYPHQLSGGQRQRVNIARALALDPRLVVCDEAVSALDKSVQAQILALLRELRTEKNLSFVFISHDLNVVEYMSDQVAVMYLGRIVETGTPAQLYRRPLHPYTKALLASVPQLGTKVREPPVVDGDVPSPLDPPSGCRFRTRCPHATEICAATTPRLEEHDQGQRVACHLYPPQGEAHVRRS